MRTITSKLWPLSRFLNQSEWEYWNPLLWNSSRQPRWYYRWFWSRSIVRKFKTDPEAYFGLPLDVLAPSPKEDNLENF
jgi:hypothetical protein